MAQLILVIMSLQNMYSITFDEMLTLPSDFLKIWEKPVQNFVSLTLLLSPQFVNYISTSKANTLLFFVDKM